MPLHESGQIIPPAIMWMFMTGNFDTAVEEGMKDQGMTGNYTLVEADAEMADHPRSSIRRARPRPAPRATTIRGPLPTARA